ncbi:YbaB/EbfC family nucleoid-associated protein [Microbacterium sp. SORGH_AS_0888]|uniref:YbaB/EbfC family nucleoid-associated protein n=1 Tax=Microbacterium sp. SORGH_AS_0888 TaxID=3041791 RepID=UPI0027D92AB5|nr:YbaB/EbfC family nucleoid-associated protein [Microbacterium sp. SORGH_AS_0888]
MPFEIQERLALRDAQYAAAYARGATAAVLQEQLAVVSGSASSLRGEVKATVSAGGLLTDLQITRHGVDLGPQALSRLIMATVRDALLDLRERLGEVVEEAGAGEIGAVTLREADAGLSGPLRALEDPGATINER